jgi:hypothetical protein
MFVLALLLCCRLQDELDRIEQQERQRTQQATAAIQAARADREGGMGAAAAVAAAGGAKLTMEMALAVINMRNRDKNVLKVRTRVACASHRVPCIFWTCPTLVALI